MCSALISLARDPVLHPKHVRRPTDSQAGYLYSRVRSLNVSVLGFIAFFQVHCMRCVIIGSILVYFSLVLDIFWGAFLPHCWPFVGDFWPD